MQNEFTIYGLTLYKDVIHEIELELNFQDSFFDIQLILTEAITNAYYHGNQSDSSKAIKITYELNDNNLHIEVQDSGDGIHEVEIPYDMSEDSILEQGGRGLYLIKCLSDKVDFYNNKLIIEKKIN